MNAGNSPASVRTFESIDLIEFNQTGVPVYVAVCCAWSVDDAEGTFQLGPQIFRPVLTLDGVAQPNLWSVLPARLISSDILIARTSWCPSTLRCGHCGKANVWLYRVGCGHHRCDRCAGDCPGTVGIDMPMDLHADGQVFQLTSWVTWDLPDRLPLPELVAKLRHMDARTSN